MDFIIILVFVVRSPKMTNVIRIIPGALSGRYFNDEWNVVIRVTLFGSSVIH